MADLISQPIVFLGATVISFNSTLGFGSQESTLSVDLVEDCETIPPQIFQPRNGVASIGQPVFFSTRTNFNSDDPFFSFGGILTNWTVTQNNSGLVYNAKVVDPRSILENTTIIIDTFLAGPIQGKNYINVYADYESDLLSEGNCSAYGSSWSSERGMPYQKIISSLQNMLPKPMIWSPNNIHKFIVDFDTFPTGLPEYYRVPGPSISILQLLQDVCEVLGLEFFVTMIIDNGGTPVIKINTISLNQQPNSFRYIIDSFNSIATDLTYGQELRNEKTRSLIFGEQQHYLTIVSQLDFFFGEDEITGEPIVPFMRDGCGNFWIYKRISSLNMSLNKPFPTNGPYTISELDIRAAMSSYQLWHDRALDINSPGSFNQAIRALYPEGVANIQQSVNTLVNAAASLDGTLGVSDVSNNPSRASVNANQYSVTEDLKKIHSFVQNLGDHYYGKSFMGLLNEKICYTRSTDGQNFSQLVFTDIPTNAGGWVDDGTSVLGLSDPELSFFREEDNRIGAFGQFSIAGEPPYGSDTTEYGQTPLPSGLQADTVE
ncbi:hypothetical protein EB118_15205 [bacterium]|nr:hypothetical protein [bacterium]NDC95326.1 hypothetical protein [bacterium]NDD85058.1 hypothetical protein [bacterium]NDG31402.1 hypothetical protein [bacterium]